MTNVYEDFGIVFPGRVSPDLKAGHQFSLKYAVDHRLVCSPEILEQFDKVLVANLSARAWPTAVASDMDLSALVMTFFLFNDDQFDGETGFNVESTVRKIEDLLAVLRDAEVSDDPIVRCFNDVLAGIRDGMSPAWRRRNDYHWEQHLRGYVQETVNRAYGMMPSLEEGIALHRSCGAVQVCLDLVERFRRFELPEYIHHLPVIAGLRNDTCDVIDLVNDLASLWREEPMGDIHNTILIIERSQGGTRRAAAGQIKARVESVVEHFINGKEQCLSSPQSVGIPDRYVHDLPLLIEGMEDWMRGNLDWCYETTRYSFGNLF